MSLSTPPLLFGLNELCQHAPGWKITYDGHERRDRHSNLLTFGVGLRRRSGACACTLPKGRNTVIRKSLNASRICIIKSFKYHSSIMEARKFKEIGMTVPYVPCNPDRRRFTCSGSHLLSSYGAFKIQNIMSWGASVLLTRFVLLLFFFINSQSSVGNSMHMSGPYFCNSGLVSSSW
jgi:hypothetical protein